MDEFASVLGRDGAYPGLNLPYLAANANFSVSNSKAVAALQAPDGQANTAIHGKVAGSTIVTLPSGERVGVVGAVIPTLPSLTQTDDVVITPAGNDYLEALAAIIQSRVDALTAARVNKIVLLAHMQEIAVEKAL